MLLRAVLPSSKGVRGVSEHVLGISRCPGLGFRACQRRPHGS